MSCHNKASQLLGQPLASVIWCAVSLGFLRNLIPPTTPAPTFPGPSQEAALELRQARQHGHHQPAWGVVVSAEGSARDLKPPRDRRQQV
jgi:hypothetical protein